MFHFHKWVYIKTPDEYKFMGETATRYILKFRKCSKCGCIQELRQLDTLSSGWCNLNSSEVEIFNRKMKWANDIIASELS